jgi:hypothetical protein
MISGTTSGLVGTKYLKLKLGALQFMPGIKNFFLIFFEFQTKNFNKFFSKILNNFFFFFNKMRYIWVRLTVYHMVDISVGRYFRANFKCNCVVVVIMTSEESKWVAKTNKTNVRILKY